MDKSGNNQPKKTPMTKEDASRIQSHADRMNTNQEFKARAQSSGDKNANQGFKSRAQSSGDKNAKK